ncbi:MAG: hypothetical protein GF334_06510 [Candidatus Altiarchaeales archaeon]|nr:hypothetical protein [Candidatus Altiarchaeales archaeon]
MLGTIDSLIVRACKDQSDTVKRLRRIWEIRCNLPTPADAGAYDRWIFQRLVLILTWRIPGRPTVEWLQRIIEHADPSDLWRRPTHEAPPYWERLVKAAAGEVMRSTVEELPEYRYAARWRDKPNPEVSGQRSWSG